SALAVAVFVVLAVFAFIRPAEKPTVRVTPYTQQVTFGYSAHVRPGPVYPNGTINTGDPLFLSLVRQLSLNIDYRLASGAASNVTGTEKVVLTMNGPSGWSRTFVLAPPTRFTGTHTSTNVTLDLPQLQKLLAKIQTLTGSAGVGTFGLSVGPQVHIVGTVAGHPVSTTFKPGLGFSFVSGQLQVTGAQSGAVGASTTASPASFTKSQGGSVSS